MMLHAAHALPVEDNPMKILLVLASLIALMPFAARASDTVFIHAGRLLDQPGKSPRGPSTLIVRDGKVAEVRDGFAPPEDGARLIELKEQFVLPGLIDMHVHISGDDNLLRSRLEASERDVEDIFVIAQGNARRTLEAGFTTVRDLGGDGRTTSTLRDAINNGLIVGPTVVPAGTMVSVTGGHGGVNGLNRSYTRAVMAERARQLRKRRARPDFSGRRGDQVRRDGRCALERRGRSRQTDDRRRDESHRRYRPQFRP
jgi:imidazolonepropionase-like amidohydrolase